MGHLLLTHATGPFNREFVAAWSSLAAQTHRAMAFIDTLAEFTRKVIERRSAGLQPIAKALCLPSKIEGASFMALLFTRCFQDATLCIRVFSEVERDCSGPNTPLTEP